MFGRMLSLCALSVVVSLAVPAAAQKSRETTEKSRLGPMLSEVDGASYSVKFEDDLLDGGGLGGTVPIIKVRRNAARSTLIRPRAHFVRELQKSVEAI